MTNTATLDNMEEVISKGKCQELQSAHDRKRETEVGVKTWEISIRVKNEFIKLIEQLISSQF